MARAFECGINFSTIISEIRIKIPSNGMRLEEFLTILGERGRLIACMLLATPFLIPLSIPGTGFVVGVIILLISLSIVQDKYYLIPDRLLKREMSYKSIITILDASFSVLTRIERYMKPRLPVMTQKKNIRTLNHIFLAFSAFLFILPLPIPLTDTLPALGVFFLAAGILECDGYLIILGYLFVTITTLYFALIMIIALKILFHFTI